MEAASRHVFNERAGPKKVETTMKVEGQCHCGEIAFEAPKDTKTYGLRVGTLQQRAELRPSRQIWFRSAQPWVTDIRNVPHVERQ